MLVDADILEGVRAIPLSKFSGLHTRICRPVGLDPGEIDSVVAHVTARLTVEHGFDPRKVKWARPVMTRAERG